MGVKFESAGHQLEILSFLARSTWEYISQHYNFNACKPSCSRFFFGVGGRGRRPLNPPTPGSGGWGGLGRLTVGNRGKGASEAVPRAGAWAYRCSHSSGGVLKTVIGSLKMAWGDREAPGEHFQRSRAVSNGAFGVQNYSPGRLRHRLRRIPGHFSMATDALRSFSEFSTPCVRVASFK